MIFLKRNKSNLICTIALLQCILYAYCSNRTPAGSQLARELMTYYGKNLPETTYAQIRHRRRSTERPVNFGGDVPDGNSQGSSPNSEYDEPIYAEVDNTGENYIYSVDSIYDNVIGASENRKSSSSDGGGARKDGSKRRMTITGKSSVSADSVIDPLYATIDFDKPLTRHNGVSRLNNTDSSTTSPSDDYTSAYAKRYNTNLSFSSSEGSDFPSSTDGPLMDEDPLSRKARNIRNARDSIKSNKGPVGPSPPPLPPKPPRTYQHKIDKDTDMFYPKNYSKQGADVVEMSMGDARFTRKKRDRFFGKFKSQKAEKPRPSISGPYPAAEVDARYYFPVDENFRFEHMDDTKSKDGSKSKNKFKVANPFNKKRSLKKEYYYDEVDGVASGEGLKQKAKAFLKLRRSKSNNDDDSSDA